METDFNTIFNNLNPVLVEFEKQRKIHLNKGLKTGLIRAIIIIFILGLFALFIDIPAFFTSMIIAGIIVGLYMMTYYLNIESKKLSIFYKQNIISKIISILHEGATFELNKGISLTAFQNSGLFSTNPDRYYSEDLISGKMDKTDFICSEVRAEKRNIQVDSKGNMQETWEDIFSGFFFIADFQKDFKGQTYVYRNNLFNFATLPKVKLENPVFGKKFKTYSTDQIEARYILTPNLMERLLQLDQKFPGQIVVSFVDSFIYIAIPDKKNHFEVSVEKKLTPKDLEKEFGTICSLINIVNDLNLNTRIWIKE